VTVYQAGQLDRRLTVLRASISYSASNAAVETWATLATVWASKEDVSAAEGVRADEIEAQDTARFIVRSYELTRGISPRDRLRFDGREYNVTGNRESRRRNHMREIDAVARSEDTDGYAVNLLRRTDRLDDTYWTTDPAAAWNVGVTPNVIAGPNGAMTADLVEVITGPDYAYVGTTVDVTQDVHTFSIYGKKDNHGLVYFWCNDLPWANRGLQAFWDVENGVVGPLDPYGSGGVDGIVTNHAIENVGFGWFRCSVTVEFPGSGPEFLFGVGVAELPPEYSLATGKGLYLAGVQLEPGAALSAYQAVP
jgi:SPP1 family predicted phage head-tail adaptor